MRRRCPIYRLVFFSIGAITLLTLFNSCSKNTYDDALPTVEFLSVTPAGINGDSLIINGKVTSQGASPIGHVGFAYFSQPTFSILQNQILLNGATSLFSTTIQGKQDSTYYFKSFAANSYGYTASSVFKYTIGAGGPAIAPCTITNGTFTENGISYSAIDINSGAGYATFGSFGVEYDDGASETITVNFNVTPVNGIYTTTSNVTNFSLDTNPFDCCISVNGSYAVNTGGKVYIAVNNNGTTTLSYCPLIYPVGSSNPTTSAKIIF